MNEQTAAPDPRHRTLGLCLLAALVALHATTLDDGYFNDDFALVGTTLTDWLANPFHAHGRPLWSLSFVLTGAVSRAAWFQHAVNLALYAGLGALLLSLVDRERRGVSGVLAVAAALAHPAMAWPVGWISQRNDLLLLLCTVAAFSSRSTSRGAGWSLLSVLTKAPFVFQAAWEVVALARRKRFLAAVALASSSCTALWFAWDSYHRVNVEAATHGLHLAKLEGPGGVLVAAVLRGAKVVEGVGYSFFPLPAFATGFGAVAAAAVAFALGWLLVLSGLRARRSDELRAASPFLVFGLLLSIPYAFGSGLRIYVPATLFLFLALARALPDSARARLGWTVVLLASVVGTALNVGPVATGRTDLSAPVFIEPPDVPAERWQALRMRLVDEFVRNRLGR